MIAFTGMTSERKVTSSSRNAAVSTKMNTSGACDFIVSLKSFELAVSPVTSALAPGTRSTVVGMSESRSCASALLERESLPFPTTGMSTSATVCAALTLSVLGCLNSGLAAASARRAAIARATGGAVTSSARTATTAGIAWPGKIFWILLYVFTTDRFCGSEVGPGTARWRLKVGIASTISTPAEATSEISGWRRTGLSTRAHSPLPPGFHGIREMIGPPPSALALLALAAQVEHRVVDTHRQADQQDHLVDRLVHGGDVADKGDDADRPRHRRERQQQRDARCDQRAERDQQDDERDRQRG